MKSSLVTTPDLIGLYQQAIKLAPSPALWRNLAPKLRTYNERVFALESAISMCGRMFDFIRCFGKKLTGSWPFVSNFNNENYLDVTFQI